MTTMLVVTMNDLPGWEIQRVCGEVMGLTVRSRNAFSQLGAGLKSLVGGELKGMTQNLVNSRTEVMNRMIEEARSRGGNAIIAMRYDTSEMGDVWTEICAYGTLCTWGELMGQTEIVELLQQNMADEENADDKLTEIAESTVNAKACEMEKGKSKATNGKMGRAVVSTGTKTSSKEKAGSAKR